MKIASVTVREQSFLALAINFSFAIINSIVVDDANVTSSITAIEEVVQVQVAVITSADFRTMLKLMILKDSLRGDLIRHSKSIMAITAITTTMVEVMIIAVNELLAPIDIVAKEQGCFSFVKQTDFFINPRIAAIIKDLAKKMPEQIFIVSILQPSVNLT